MNINDFFWTKTPHSGPFLFGFFCSLTIGSSAVEKREKVGKSGDWGDGMGWDRDWGSLHFKEISS